jgi:hypothetical protein
MSDAAIAGAKLADDMLTGIPAIAECVGRPPQTVAYHLVKGHLPAFMIGNIWHMRRSTYAAFIAKLETAAIARAMEATMT